MALKGISGDGELGRGRCGGLGRCERSGLGWFALLFVAYFLRGAIEHLIV